MSYLLRKFVVQPVLGEVGPDGDVVREFPADPVTLFTPRQLADYADRFPAELEKFNHAQQEPANGKPPTGAARRAVEKAKP